MFAAHVCVTITAVLDASSKIDSIMDCVAVETDIDEKLNDLPCLQPPSNNRKLEHISPLHDFIEIFVFPAIDR